MEFVLDDDIPKLLPCPFCGREPVLSQDKRYPPPNGNPKDVYVVMCNNFGCPIYRADNTYFFNKIDAVNKWNKRKQKGENNNAKKRV